MKLRLLLKVSCMVVAVFIVIFHITLINKHHSRSVKRKRTSSRPLKKSHVSTTTANIQMVQERYTTTHSPELIVTIKTTSSYHETRLRLMLDSWMSTATDYEGRKVTLNTHFFLFHTWLNLMYFRLLFSLTQISKASHQVSSFAWKFFVCFGYATIHICLYIG